MIEGPWREIVVDADWDESPLAWLASQTRGDMPWLLAHADDGVIWGKREGAGFKLSSGVLFAKRQAYPALQVEFRPLTLQQVRVFGPDGELLVWREGDGFRARLALDGPQAPDCAIEERHLLWGRGQRDVVERREGFVLLEEGGLGVCHAPPLEPNGEQRLKLRVRHYLAYDDEGQAYIRMSRLVDLEA